MEWSGHKITFRLGDELKTDFVRQKDEEAKENEPQFRDVKKQEEELERGRQAATARYGLLAGERQTGCHGTLRTASWGEADRMPRHATEVITSVCRAFRSCVKCRCQHDVSKYQGAFDQTNKQILYQFLFTFQVTTAATTNLLHSVIEC